jgi:hypothetical protein
LSPDMGYALYLLDPVSLGDGPPQTTKHVDMIFRTSYQNRRAVQIL